MGKIAAGSYHELKIPITNPLTERFYLFGLSTSCGCLRPMFQPGFVEPGCGLEVRIILAPKETDGAFSESVLIETSRDEVDGLGFRVSGTAVPFFSVVAEPNFGTLTSEDGGEAELIFQINDAPNPGMDTALVETVKNARIHLGEFHLPLEIDQDSVQVVSQSPGLFLGTALIRLLPCSERGRMEGAFVALPLPDAIGGGWIDIPMRGALVPTIRIEPSSVLDLRTWDTESPGVATFVLFAEEGRLAPSITFPTLSGSNPPFAWTVELGGSLEEALATVRVAFAVQSEPLEVELPRFLEIPCKIADSNLTLRFLVEQ